MPVRRTSPSTRHGEMTERPADVPLGDGDSDRDVAQPRSGWLCSRSRRQRRHVSNAGRRSRFRFVPIGSHSCCCLRRRPRRQPTYPSSRSRPASRHNTLRSPGNSTLEPQFPAASGGSTHDAKLQLASQSRRLRAITLSAHCRALTQLNFTPLDFSTPLPHTAKYVLSLARSTLNCRLSRNFFASPLKTCASHVSTQSPDLTDSHKADLSGHARTQATTAYTWRQKINTSLQADSLTTVTPYVKVHVSTWRAVLTIAASP